MKIELDEYNYLELLTQSLYLQALESEGVDNWVWYSTAIQNFIQMVINEDTYMEEYFKSLGKITKDGILDDLDIEDLAKYYLDVIKEQQEEENAST